LSYSSIYIPSTKIVATSIILALSTEFTITPCGLSTTPVHVTSTHVTSTTPTPCLTGDCNRVTARDRFRHPPAWRLAPLVPSSHPSKSLSSSSFLPSHKIHRSFVTLVTTIAHTPTTLAPTRVDLFSIYFSQPPIRKDYEASVENGIEADGEADRDADAEAGSEAGVRIDIRDEAYTKDYDTDIKADIAADTEVDTQIGVEAEIEDKAKESDRDTIKIGVDAVYPDPDNLSVFPMVAIVVS
nr:hypothetical protein [Tanacetum cinerariifolium]